MYSYKYMNHLHAICTSFACTASPPKTSPPPNSTSTSTTALSRFIARIPLDDLGRVSKIRNYTKPGNSAENLNMSDSFDLTNKKERKAEKERVQRLNKAARKNAREKSVVTLRPALVADTLSDYVQLSSVVAKERELKAHNRHNYTIRMKESLPEGYKSQSEISPILDRFATPLFTNEERLAAYAHRHKCKHGLSFNKITNPWNSARYLSVRCDHQFDGISQTMCRCPRCGSKEALHVQRPCNHEGIVCPRCKATSYRKGERYTMESCSCANATILSELETAYGHSLRDELGKYDLEKKSNDLSEFLTRVTITKPKPQKGSSFSSVTKKRESIKEWLLKTNQPDIEPPLELSKEEFPELTKVIPEGGAFSAITTPIKTAYSTTVESIVTSIRSFYKTIEKWILETVSEEFYKKNTILCDLMGFFCRLGSNLCKYFMSLKPPEMALLAACLLGSSKQRCVALATIVTGLISQDNEVFVGPVATGVRLLNTSIGQIFDSFTQDKQDYATITVQNKRKIGSWKAKYNLSYTDSKNIVEFVMSRGKPEDVDDAKRINKDLPEDEYLDAEETDPQKQVIKEGLSDVLSILVTMMPFKYQGPMFKTVSLFCKEILPIMMVAKHTTSFVTSVWTWLKKIFGYCLTDTKQWLQLELQTPDSPIRNCVTDSLTYRLEALGDLPTAPRSLIKAKDSLVKATEYIKECNRYDTITIKMITDTEKLISSTALPPAAREHEPFAVRLYGKPGTGKSRSVPVIFGPILGAQTPSEFYQKTYARNMQEYWDGVGTRQCILYDDFGQNRAEPSDLMEFILLISAAPFMANFANITGSTPKGMSIDPKLVIACSNLSEDYTNAVTENAAIHRRFHVKLHSEIENGQTFFTVTGGSLTGYTGPDGNITDRFVPITKRMTVLETQEYMYYAYQVFLKTRISGVTQLTDKMVVPPKLAKPLIVGTKSGASEIVTEQSDMMKFFKQHEKKVDISLSVPKGIPYSESIQTIRVSQESSIDLSWCIDAFCEMAITDHMTFFLGALLTGSYFFMKDIHESRWLNSLKTLMVPTVTALLTVVMAAFYFRSKEVEPESNHSKEKGNPKRVSAEGGAENRAVTDAQAVLEKATCRIRCLANNMTLNGLLVGENYLLTVEHLFVPAIDDGTMHGDSFYHPKGTEFELYVPNVVKPYVFKFDRSRMRTLTKERKGKIQDIDVVVYALPNTVPMRKKIVSRFWDGTLILKDQKGLVLDYKRGTREQIWKETTLSSEEYVWYSSNGKAWHQDLMYGTHTSSPGSCGSPVMLATGNTNSPIVGLHIAHNPHKHLPMIVILTKELIMKMIPEFSGLNPPPIDGDHTVASKVIQEAEMPKLLDETSILLLGNTVKPMFTPIKTTLRKSLVHDAIFPHTTEPSILHPYDSRLPESLKGNIDLFRDGVLKMKDQVTISEEEIKPVFADMSEWYQQKFITHKRYKGVPLSFSELLNSGEVLKSIDMTTSPGYPFTFQSKNRTDLFERDKNDLLRLKAPFLEQLLVDLEEIQKGNVPQWFVTAALKDERRPIDKVRIKPKTRLFTVCPIVLILLEKRYFGRFMENLLSSEDVPYAGGIDRLGISWHHMFMDLKKISDRGFGGDYQCYDGKISSLLIKQCTNLMLTSLLSIDGKFKIAPRETDGELASLRLVEKINSLELSDSLIVKAVQQTLQNPIYLMKGFVFQVNGSLASGCWSTQLIGSLVGEMLQRTAWNDLVPPHIKGGYFYKKYVGNKIMGDDNINSVELSVTKWYNGEAFSQWLAERNMIYTSADKKGLAKPIEPLEEISFLKNTTGTMYGYFCPLMEFDAAVEPINWVRESKYTTPVEALEMNANAVLRAVFFRGRDTFNSIRNQLKELVPQVTTLDFETLKRQYLNYGGFPGAIPETFNYSEEMNQAAKELPYWQPENDDLHQVEVFCDQLHDEEFESPAASKENQTMDCIRVNKEGSENCQFCGKCYSSRNRLIDHIILDHQKQGEWRNEDTLIGMLREASIGELKQWYAELMGTVAKTDISTQGASLLKDTPYTDTQLITTLNNMIAYQKNPQVFSNIRNQNAKSIPMELIYRPQVVAPPKPKPRKLPAELAMVLNKYVRDPYEDEYHVVSEGSIEDDDGAIMFASAPVWTEAADEEFDESKPTGTDMETVELPIVTDPDAVTSKKDPMSEETATTRSQGTILSDKDKIDRVVVKTKGSVTAKRAETTLNDQAWSLENMLQKWYPVDNIAWTTAHVAGDTLWSGDVVRDLIKTSFSGAAFTIFKDFRCAGVKIRATVVASKWHQGRVVVGFSPSMVPAASSGYVRKVTPEDLIQIGAVKLDPSQGTSAELYIPFRHPKQYLALEEFDCLGQLMVQVLSPLKTATTASTETVIKLFFSLDKPMFKIPRANTLTFRLMSELEKKFSETLIPASCERFTRVTPHSGFQPGSLSARDIKLGPTKLRANLSTRGTMSEKIKKADQPGINEYPREGTAIAAKRAATGDPTVRHFGERETNMVNYGKRYRSVYKEVGTLSTNIKWFEISMPTIMNQFWVLHLFNLYRGAMNFKARIILTPATANVNPQGKVSIFYEPNPVGTIGMNHTALDQLGTDVPRCEGKTGDTLEFQIPFLQRSAVALNPFHYVYNKQSTSPYFMDGQLYVRLETRSTANQINLDFDLWAAFADEFGMGVFRGVPDIKLDNALPGWNTARVEAEGLLDDVASAGMAAIEKKISPKNVLGTALAALDKPAISTQPQLMIPKNHAFMNFADGPEPIDKLTLHAGRQQLIDAEHFGTNENEADFQSLFARPNLFGKFTWKTEHQVGDLLTQIPVHPTFEVDGAGSTFRPTIMCWLASKFKYWRGGITFIFEVVGTNFHEGRLDVTYHPNTLVVPANYDTRVSQYTLSCAVKNTENRFAVTAPYLSEEPFRRVHNGQAVAEPLATADPPALTEFMNGVLAISVGAPLRVPDGVPQDVEVLMYVLPATDFEFNTVCLSGRSMVDVDAT